MASEDKGRVYYGTGLDNSGLKQGAKEAKQVLHSVGDSAVQEGERMDDTFSKLGKTVAGVFAASQLAEFTKKVASVRGEFQQLEIAFRTMLGSGEKADALMSQLIKTAATTPFGMSDIAQASKQLLAYGVQAEEVNDTLIRLGDIAAGLSIPIGDLAYLYGTTMVQGRLFTQDLRQFTGRGIPMTEELAKVMGVTKDEVAGLVTAGKIGFAEVQEAIKNLTDEGSKFGGLMVAQSTTITGQMSNIEDSIEQMFNEIGRRSEDAISSALSSVSTIVDSWEEIGRALLVVVTAYGTYKAAVLAVAAAHKIAAIAKEAQLFLQLTKYITSAKDAMLLLNMATKANPWALVASVVATAASALLLFRKRNDEAVDSFGEARTRINEEVEALNALFKVAKDDTKSRKERAEAIDTINARYGDYLDNLVTEKDSVEKLDTAYRSLSSALQGKYLEELRSSMVGGAQSKAATAEGNLWNVLGSITKRSGLSAGRQGAMTAEMQQWISKYSKSNSATEIYNALVAIYEKFGGEGLTGRQQGQLLGIIQDFKDAATELTRTEKSFAAFASGYTGALGQEGGTDTDATEGETVKKVKELTEEEKKAAKKAEEERKKRQEEFVKQYGTYKQKLEQLNADWDKTIASFADGSAEQELATRQKKAALAAFNFEWLDANSIDKDAIRDALEEKLDAEIAALEDAAKPAAEARKALTLAEFDGERTQSMLDYLKDWGTFEQQRLAIAAEYDRKIAETDDAWLQKSLEKQKQSALYDFDLANSGQLKKFFVDPARQSKALLKENIEYATKLLEKYKDQPDVVKDINEQLAAMRNEYDTIDFEGYDAGVSTVISRTIELLNAKREYKTLTKEGSQADVEATQAAQAAIERAQENLKKSLIATGIDTFVGGLQKAADLMAQIAESTNDASLADAAAQLQSFAQNLNSAYEGFKQGGWIGAIVGGVTDWIEQAVSAYAEARAAESQYALEHEKFINRLNTANLSLDADIYDTIFGTLSITKGIDGWKKAQDAIFQYEEAVNKAYTETTAKQKRSDRKLQGGWGGLIFSAGLAFNPIKNNKKYTNQYLQQKKAIDRGLTELQAMSIKTKSRNGFQKFWGAEDQYKSLVDVAPQLWGEGGEFDIEAAKLFLETTSKLTDEQREQIQNVIDLQEAYDEAIAAIDESISSVLGSLGEDMADAIWDSVVNGGEDAWSRFEEIGGEAIADLGKQMLKEMIVTDYLEQFRDKLREAYKNGDPQDVATNVSAVVAEMLNGARAQMEVWGAAAQAYSDTATAMGFSPADTDTSREASTKEALAGASQESIDALSGVMTSVQGHTFTLAENSRILVANTTAILASVLTIEGHTERLAAVEEGVRGLRATLDDIALKGIKIK